MKKRIFVILILLIAFILPSNAVLKEDSITTTLYILRSELTNAHLEMEKQAKQTKDSQKQLFEQTTQILNQANLSYLHSLKTSTFFVGSEKTEPLLPISKAELNRLICPIGKILLRFRQTTLLLSARDPTAPLY